MQNASTSFVMVRTPLFWSDARQYCRNQYTDLASVTNQAQNDLMKKVVITPRTWIGLYRDSWKWSDGSPLSFSSWSPGSAPTTVSMDTCVVSNLGQWINTGCTTPHYFVCYAGELSSVWMKM